MCAHVAVERQPPAVDEPPNNGLLMPLGKCRRGRCNCATIPTLVPLARLIGIASHRLEVIADPDDTRVTVPSSDTVTKLCWPAELRLDDRYQMIDEVGQFEIDDVRLQVRHAVLTEPP